MIDSLYIKEKKYVKQYVREDYLQGNDFIFNLKKSHPLNNARNIGKSTNTIRHINSNSFNV